MFNRNRKVDKDEIDSIPFAERVEMEAKITDARAEQLDLNRYSRLPVAEYWAANAWRRHVGRFLGDLQGLHVLDVCCGYSMTPVRMALMGATVAAVDVSPVSLEKVHAVAEMHGVSPAVETVCGPAESLPFEDDTFDVIFGGAALHHLILEKAGREFARLLRPGGRGIFQDPLGHNPLLEFARDNINYENKHVEKGTDKPLQVPDIEQFGSYFKSYHWYGYDLTAALARGFGVLKPLRPTFEQIDAAILKILPPVRRYARFALIEIYN